jgi:hypothetical protein
MQYILIQNDGEIELAAFELIGASTKRNQAGKIGFFGSGLKYAIAFMMRTGMGFRIFTGEQELIFTGKEEQFREQTFTRICINGNPTSYTTTMGPTWTEPWFVLREIYCNALDETNCQLIKSTEDVNASAGKTRIYVELTPDLQKIVENWDAYFSADREPIFEAPKVYTTYLGAKTLNQSVKVYHKTDGVIYRKGIRVYVNKKCLYDYEMEDININEDRTATNSSALSYAICDLFTQLCNENYVTHILRSFSAEEPTYEFMSLSSGTSDNQSVSDKWVQFSKDYFLVIRENAGHYTEQISKTKREVFYMPMNVAKKIKKWFPDAEILGIGKAFGDVFMDEAPQTEKIKYLIKDISRQLTEMGYSVDYPISVAVFENDTILGHADTKDKHIYIAAKTFDMGRREIALTIMEECEHINSGHEDESRAFQSHLLSTYLKKMEESNGIFL